MGYYRGVPQKLSRTEQRMTQHALSAPTERQRKERAEAERISQLAGQWEAAEVARAVEGRRG